MPVERINWDKHDVVECDDRGRATLGSEYAGERVFVYVAELPDGPDAAGEPVGRAESQTLSKMLSWAMGNDIDTLTHLLDPETGVVTDKHGNEHQSPYRYDAEADEMVERGRRMPEHRIDADRIGDAAEWLLAYTMGGFIGLLLGGFAGRPGMGLYFGLAGMWLLRSTVSYEYDPDTKSSHLVIDTGPTLREEYRDLKAWIGRRLS